MTDTFPLYNIKRGPHGYAIGKFDTNLNLLAAYNTDAKYCSCPAGPRPTCRHRKMLPRMLAKVDTDEFYCYETQTWSRPFTTEDAELPIEPLQLSGPAIDRLASEAREIESQEPTIETYIELPPDADVAEEFSKLLEGEARSRVIEGQEPELTNGLPAPTLSSASPSTPTIRRR